MRALLDTHSLLWFLNDDKLLSDSARRLIEADDNDVFVSMASLWEVAIKLGIGKLSLGRDYASVFPDELGANALDLLSVQIRHLSRLVELPLHHRDPFDRLIVAQALEERMVIVGRDERFDDYGVERFW